MSKAHSAWCGREASPRAASRRRKKDLALMAMTYGTVYVARVAMGGSDAADIHRRSARRKRTRAVAHHRLQPLHRPRLRSAPRHGSAEGRRPVRPLAALPLQPGSGRAGPASAPARFQGAERARSSRTPTTRPRYSMLRPQRSGNRPASSWKRRRAMFARAGGMYEHLPALPVARAGAAAGERP